MNRLAKSAVALAAMAASVVVFAVEVTPDQAQTAVKNWIRKNPRPMTAQFATGNGVAKAYAKDGKTLFHVVQLEGGGFVVTSGDTKISPIVAFSDDGVFDVSEANPLVKVLRLDMAARAKSIAGNAAPSVPRLLAATSVSADKTAAEKEWEDLLSVNTPNPVRLLAATSTGITDAKMSDIRVAPLIKTKWSQSTWGDCTDIPVYNRFTPNYSVCGCVATAGAQLMKYFAFPENNITAWRSECKVDGKTVVLQMKGGTYEWGKMPNSYAETPNISKEQQEAIGKLTYDLGVAVGMSYTLEDSGASTPLMVYTLSDVFGYASADVYRPWIQYPSSISDDEQLKNAVFASLDSRCPIVASLTGECGGHCILFDGYGYYGEIEYVHLNFGWSGSCNAWYDVFGQKADTGRNGLWYLLKYVGYNISPSETGSIISGRVIDKNGNAVPGATVQLNGENGMSATCKSDERGVWYKRVLDSARYSIKSSANGLLSKESLVVLPKKMQFEETTTTVNAGVVANKWGVDLTLESASDVIEEDPVQAQVAAPVFTPAEGTFTSSSIQVKLTCGTSGATIYYTKDGSTPTTSSTRYTGAVTISGTTQFKAIAIKSGMANSEVVSKTYTKVVVKPTISIGTALDDTSRTYTASDNTLAVGQDDVTHDGVDALKLSCPKTSGAKTSVTATFAGAGTLSFWWCDPSATAQYSTDMGTIIGYINYFYCTVKNADGTEYGSWKCSGPSWEKCEIPLPAGTYTVEWSVSAGYAMFAAARTSYVDEVSFVAYSGGSRKVYFNANGGNGSAEKTAVTAAFADTVAVSGQGTLELADHLFVGWSRDSSAVQAEYEIGDTLKVGAQDIVLYAVWKKILPVLVEIPQSGGDAEESLSLYGNSYTAYIAFPPWAGSFKMSGVTSSGGMTTVSLGNGRSRLSITGDLSLHFTAGANDTAEDRSFDLDMDAKNYPYVIRYHVVQKADVVTDKPKGLVVDGASSVVSSSGAAFSSQVVRRNGSVDAVSPTWSVVSGGAYASVTSSGELTAKSVSSPQTVVIRAAYSEDGVPVTADREVTILPVCDLNTALDNSDLTFQTGAGADAWFGQSNVSCDGVDAARASSALGGTPWIKTIVEGPAIVSFDCLMSADGGNAFYFVDNGKTNECAFSVPMTIPSWQHKRFSLKGEGSHVIEFVYVHNGGSTGVAGADAAWLDNLVVTPVKGGVCDISLAKTGWHLVSFSVLPDDPSPENVFGAEISKIGSIADMGSLLWTPSYATLRELKVGEPYWVNTTQANIVLSVVGAPDPGRSYSLKKGYSRIGFSLTESGATATVLKTALESGAITHVVDDGSLFYPGGGLETMSPGKVYWVYAPAACVISFEQ